MSITIALKVSDIRAIIDAAFPNYRGTKASVRIQESIEYTTADFTWQGGSKTEVVALRWNGESFDRLDLNRAFRSEHTTVSGKIPDEAILVEHIIFCGKDLGIRCVISPSCVYLPKLNLPQRIELNSAEIFILSAHAQLKSSYRDEAYKNSGLGLFDDGTLWDHKNSLIKRKLLSVNKLGATQITTEGKNALATLPVNEQVRL